MPGQAYVVARPFTNLLDEQAAIVALWRDDVRRIRRARARLCRHWGCTASSRTTCRGAPTSSGVRSAPIGIVVGTGIAFALGSRIEPLRFKVSAHDPLVYGAVAALLMAVAIVASARPALRAARADPNLALRAE